MPHDRSADDVLAVMDGLGTIEVPAEQPVDVGYTITLVVPGAGQPEPPGGSPVLTRVEVRARVADLYHWYAEHRTDLVLRLEDGRRLPLIMTSPDGAALGQHGLA